MVHNGRVSGRLDRRYVIGPDRAEIGDRGCPGPTGQSRAKTESSGFTNGSGIGHVEVAQDGKGAVSSVRNQPPDVVCDVHCARSTDRGTGATIVVHHRPRVDDGDVARSVDGDAGARGRGPDRCASVVVDDVAVAQAEAIYEAGDG